MVSRQLNVTQDKTRVSNASGFYLRASASPVNSSQFRAILRNSAQLRAIREQLRAIPRKGIATGNHR